MTILMNTIIPTIKKALSPVDSGRTPAPDSPLAGIDKLILRRQRDAVTRNGYISLLGRILVIAIAGWIFFSQLFMLLPVSGNGMFPAVKDGDLIIGYRLQRDLYQDDVVVYEDGERMLVGRVIARGGDVVNMGSDGVLTVNGTAQTGEIMYPTYAREGVSYPYTVPEGHIFVLGDYRTQSQDSRDFGAISLEKVTAKVITILRRRGI